MWKKNGNALSNCFIWFWRQRAGQSPTGRASTVPCAQWGSRSRSSLQRLILQLAAACRSPHAGPFSPAPDTCTCFGCVPPRPADQFRAHERRVAAWQVPVLTRVSLLVLLAAHVLRRAQPSHQCLGCLQPLPGACVPRAGAGGDPAHRAHAGGGQPWCPGACCRRCCCTEADEDGQAGGRSPTVAAPAVPVTACAGENVVLWQKQTASITSADGVLPWLRAGRARSPMPCLWLCSWPCSPEGSGALRVS